MTQTKRSVLIVIAVVLISIGLVYGVKHASEPPLPVASEADFVLQATSINVNALSAHGLPILIDFGADKCIPCKEMAPILEQLNEAYRNKVIVKFVDVWKNPDGSAGFPVDLIPTQFFYGADGKPLSSPNAHKYGLVEVRNENGELMFTKHQGGISKEALEALFVEMQDQR